MLFKKVLTVFDHLFSKKYFLTLYLLFSALRYITMIWYYERVALAPLIGFTVILLLSIGSLFNLRYVTKILSALIAFNSIGALALVGYAIYRKGTGELFGYTLGTSSLSLLVGFISAFFLIGAVRLWRQ